MVTQVFIDAFMLVVSGFFKVLPDFSWNVESGNFQTFLDVVGSVAYLLPINTINQIIALTVSFLIFKAVIAFIKTVVDLLSIIF